MFRITPFIYHSYHSSIYYIYLHWLLIYFFIYSVKSDTLKYEILLCRSGWLKYISEKTFVPLFCRVHYLQITTIQILSVSKTWIIFHFRFEFVLVICLFFQKFWKYILDLRSYCKNSTQFFCLEGNAKHWGPLEFKEVALSHYWTKTIVWCIIFRMF